MSTFLRDILSKGRIWESVDQRVVEKQEKGEDALERLLARQEETAALVRGLVKQVDLYPYSYLYFYFRLYLTFVFAYIHLDTGGRAAPSREGNPETAGQSSSGVRPFQQKMLF